MSITPGWSRIAAAAAAAHGGRCRNAYATSAARQRSARTAGTFIRTRIVGSLVFVAVRKSGSTAVSSHQMYVVTGGYGSFASYAFGRPPRVMLCIKLTKTSMSPLKSGRWRNAKRTARPTTSAAASSNIWGRRNRAITSRGPRRRTPRLRPGSTTREQNVAPQHRPRRDADAGLDRVTRSARREEAFDESGDTEHG